MKVYVKLELPLVHCVGQPFLSLWSPSHHSWNTKISVSCTLQSHQYFQLTRSRSIRYRTQYMSPAPHQTQPITSAPHQIQQMSFYQTMFRLSNLLSMSKWDTFSKLNKCHDVWSGMRNVLHKKLIYYNVIKFNWFKHCCMNHALRCIAWLLICLFQARPLVA